MWEINRPDPPCFYTGLVTVLFTGFITASAAAYPVFLWYGFSGGTCFGILAVCAMNIQKRYLSIS